MDISGLWYNFNFLKFTEVWFVTQDVVYLGEYSMCTWEGVFFRCGWNLLKISVSSISSNVSFKTCFSLLIFCFDDVSFGISGVLKSPTIIVFLSISPFISVSVCYINLGALTLGVYMLMSAMSSSCIDPLIIWCPSLSFFMDIV